MQKRKSFNNNSFELSKFLNENISLSDFLVINEKGENLGIIEKQKALFIAKNSNLDLYCISPNSTPPVCRIIDSSKFFYKKKKNSEKNTKKKTQSFKEISFSYRIGLNDLKFKTQKVINWLNSDDVVKMSLIMRGREQIHKDIALEKCKSIISEIQNASPQFQLKDSVKLVGNSYIFSFFKNKKVSSKNEN